MLDAYGYVSCGLSAAYVFQKCIVQAGTLFRKCQTWLGSLVVKYRSGRCKLFFKSSRTLCHLRVCGQYPPFASILGAGQANATKEGTTWRYFFPTKFEFCEEGNAKDRLYDRSNRTIEEKSHERICSPIFFPLLVLFSFTTVRECAVEKDLLYLILT